MTLCASYSLISAAGAPRARQEQEKEEEEQGAGLALPCLAVRTVCSSELRDWS